MFLVCMPPSSIIATLASLEIFSMGFGCWGDFGFGGGTISHCEPVMVNDDT